MEDYLNKVNNLKACYEKHSYEQVMAMNNQELRALCSEERLQVIRDLFSDRLTTSSLIPERFRILNERENAKVQNRRDFLDKRFV